MLTLNFLTIYAVKQCRKIKNEEQILHNIELIESTILMVDRRKFNLNTISEQKVKYSHTDYKVQRTGYCVVR